MAKLSLLLVMFGAACNSTSILNSTPDAATDAATDAEQFIGGPCAVTYESDCEIQTCLDAQGNVQTVTRTALDDAGTGCN